MYALDLTEEVIGEILEAGCITAKYQKIERKDDEGQVIYVGYYLSDIIDPKRI